MKKEKKQEWLEKGYRFVAENGFENLSTNSLARMVGKSKSSFYHYFGTLELFTTDLLDFHLEQVHRFSASLQNCENINPDVINVFIEHKTDMFFNRQIRIHRDKPIFKKYIAKAFDIYEETVSGQLANYLGLGLHRGFAKKFIRFASEHFILSITTESYNREWINNYLKEVTAMIRQIKRIN